MKKITLIVTALIMALLIAGTMPAQVFADSIPEYISEVKIGMGKEAKDAEAALAGYKILTDEKGNKVDLNQSAGGGLASKGEKVVYLGYKTTTDRKDAITDLALMNMKGKYSVEEYEALMEKQMKSQIIPFVENFQAAIDEYRQNYYSANPDNQARAQYIHDILDKFTDDDCGGKGLGELLLNDTKYEMGVKAYNKLSDEDKAKTDIVTESNKAYDALPEEGRKNHADILTILAQSNGKATLMMENLLTRAADSNDDTWLDRFAGITYDDLVKSMDMLPTDAQAEVAKMYDDDARAVLKMWEPLHEVLAGYDGYVEFAKKYNDTALSEAVDTLENADENATGAERDEIIDAYVETIEETTKLKDALEAIALHDFLEQYEYGEGSLLDFFLKDTSEFEEDITPLYALVASLSDGQRAGLEFVSLREFVSIAATTADSYSAEDLDALEEISIYDGIDRGIYQKGGVALTSDALRSKATDEAVDDINSALSGWTIAMLAITGVSFLAMVGTSIASGVFKGLANSTRRAMDEAIRNGRPLGRWLVGVEIDNSRGMYRTISRYQDAVYREYSAFARKLAIGFTVAMVVVSLVTTYLMYRDMADYYKVDFTPIPHYMVDEKDITTYNEKGEQIILKNQSAYYKAVECNRTQSDEFYNMLGTCADMNGDVGRQWLALYAQKSDTFAPILANSLLVKVKDSDLPAGYTTGIHMFGSGSAFNLNSELYDWNKSAPSVMVYFKTDTASSGAKAAGSNFTAGSLAIAGVAGLAIGAIASSLAVKAAGSKKKKAEA